MANTTCCCVSPGVPNGHASFDTKPGLVGEQDFIFKGYLFSGEGNNGRKKASVKVGRYAGWKEEFCKTEVTKCQKVQELTKHFNKTQTTSTKIRYLVPRMATLDTVHTGCINRGRKLSPDEWVLIFEERINSSSVCPDGITETFMHFAYHITGGQLVVGGFGGGNADHQVVLTHSSVHSINRQYGALDKGPDGIKTAFRDHTCNEVCHSWLKPVGTEEVKDSSSINLANRPRECSPSAPPFELYSAFSEEQPCVTSFQVSGGHFEEQNYEPCRKNDEQFVSPANRNSVVSAVVRQAPVYSGPPAPVYSERPPPYREFPPSYADSCMFDAMRHDAIRTL